MKVFNIKLIYFLVLLSSCTKVPTINLKQHTFNKAPDNIVLVQVANLEAQSIVNLKHSQISADSKIFSEKYICSGQMWRINHTQMKPSLEDSLFTQLTGFPRSESGCDKYNEEKLFWEKLIGFGFGAILYERGQSNLVATGKTCNDSIFKNTMVFNSSSKSKMFEAIQTESFHPEKAKSYQNGKIYLDESCFSGECFSREIESFNHVWNSINNYPRKIMVYRNFELQKGSSNKERINDLNKFLTYLVTEFSQKNPNTLVLITSTSELSDRSQVWSNGPLAENFCGEFSELGFYNRIFWRSEDSKFMMFNDFN